MYAQPAQLNFDQPLFNAALPTPVAFREPAAGLREPTRAYAAIAPAPRMIKSVVEEAGLGRFVYLQGQSGKRYVFSPISQEQVPLYDNALFAVSEPGNDFARVVEKQSALPDRGCIYYVHLLGDDAHETKDVLNDLGGFCLS